MNTDMNRLEPVFDFAACQSRVLLNQGPAQVSIDGNTYAGEGEVWLDLIPRARVRFAGRFKGMPFVDAMMTTTGQKRIRSFSINAREVEGFPFMSRVDTASQEMILSWRPKSEPVIGIGNESTEVVRVIFHLFNFVDLIGTRRSVERNGKARYAIEHIDLISDEWKMELKSLLATRDNIQLLKDQGGYRLTHVGSLERADGAPFSGKDAGDCLNALRSFLSFAKGGWCEPVCAVGMDSSGSRVWESWSSPREPWHNPPSWFDPHHGSQLARLFSGFMKRWSDEDWREGLHEVIYWYVNANQSSRGIDVGIILTQAAIERLSYEFCVKERRLLSVKGFKDLWASDRFRLLFSSLRIPLDIPAHASELLRLASSSQVNWLDGPHALTEIRNCLVHPEHKWHRQFSSAYYEAWNLGLWYLEVGILAICGYSGDYGNRLRQQWVGETEDVPWT